MTEVLQWRSTPWLLPTQLLHAINNDDRRRALQVLEAGLDCDHRFRHGNNDQPALSLCVNRGRFDIMRVLIQHGCSVNQVDSAGVSALHRAAHLGRVDMVRLLLRHRANANSTDACRWQTALHAAAERGQHEVLQLLLAAGAEPDRLDVSGHTPLMLACAAGHQQMALTLLRAGASAAAVSDAGLSALQLLCTAAAAEPQLVTTAAADQQLVTSAAEQQLVTALLAAGDQLERQAADGCTPLLRAVLAGRLATVRALLAAGADVSARTHLGQCAVQLAARRRDEPLLRELLLHGADGGAALHCLLRHGGCAVDLLQLLLAAGERPDAPLRRAPALQGAEYRRLREAAGAPAPLGVLCRRSVLSLRLRRPREAIDALPLPAAVKRFLALDT